MRFRDGRAPAYRDRRIACYPRGVDSRLRRWVVAIVVPVSLWSILTRAHGDVATVGTSTARTTVWVITLCLVIAGVFTAALWARWRVEPSYGWFAAAMFAWAVVNLNVLVVDIPIGGIFWYGLRYGALGCWALLVALFLSSFLGDRPPFIAGGSLVLGVAGPAAVALLVALDSRRAQLVACAWITCTLLVLAYATRGIARVVRGPAVDVGVVLPNVLGVSVLGCAVHDWAIVVGLDATDHFYLPYAAPPVLVGMGWALLRRFVGALRHSEALVADLVRRVELKRRELARSHARLREVERIRILAGERERLMREMHDGLGTHLVSTLSLLDGHPTPREAVAAAIRAALDDLRLMIDSLEPLEGDLLGALAMLRTRMQPRLEAAGIGVEWRVSDLPLLADLGPHKVLQVLRILQEAVTNVLKHAGARSIIVRTGADDLDAARRSIRVEIIDDGRGFDPPGSVGRGLHHMRGRAMDIGATVEIHASPSGTTVTLRIPAEIRGAA